MAADVCAVENRLELTAAADVRRARRVRLLELRLPVHLLRDRLWPVCAASTAQSARPRKPARQGQPGPQNTGETAGGAGLSAPPFATRGQHRLAERSPPPSLVASADWLTPTVSLATVSSLSQRPARRQGPVRCAAAAQPPCPRAWALDPGPAPRRQQLGPLPASLLAPGPRRSPCPSFPLSARNRGRDRGRARIQGKRRCRLARSSRTLPGPGCPFLPDRRRRRGHRRGKHALAQRAGARPAGTGERLMKRETLAAASGPPGPSGVRPWACSRPAPRSRRFHTSVPNIAMATASFLFIKHE
ncbi:uncharacterized protein LOC132211746 [Myotis daubentonii]|uniref:uncharacterized protein LOC132211746 n=1 Tax=Myotis daubentonii TaxID=98922 RepID=UPI002872B978|nr:uncharacterized protein LOC132211746 [Myotis daubentonii]